MRVDEFGELVQNVGHLVTTLTAADVDDDLCFCPFCQLMLGNSLTGTEGAGDGCDTALGDREHRVDDALTGDQGHVGVDLVLVGTAYTDRPLLHETNVLFGAIGGGQDCDDLFDRVVAFRDGLDGAALEVRGYHDLVVDNVRFLNGTDDVTGHDGVACSDAGDEVPFLFTVQGRDFDTSLEVVPDHRADVLQRSLDTVVNCSNEAGPELYAQRSTGRHDFRAGAKSRSLFVDLDGRTVFVHFDNLTNQSLLANTNNVVHVGVPHAVSDDQGACDLGNSTFGHFRFTRLS